MKKMHGESNTQEDEDIFSEPDNDMELEIELESENKLQIIVWKHQTILHANNTTQLSKELCSVSGHVPSGNRNWSRDIMFTRTIYRLGRNETPSL